MRMLRPLFLFEITPRLLALVCASLACLSLVACAPASHSDGSGAQAPTEQLSESYAGKIYFESRRFTFEGESECISAENDALVIKKGGAYIVSGKLTEGRIVTDAPFVRLVLDGAELCSSVGSVIEARRGALVIESEDGSLNIIRAECSSSDGRRGAIYTDGDLFLSGGGKTVITARGLTYALACGRLYCESGELSLTAEGGVFACEAYLSGGKTQINGAKTGIYAENLIEMTGGSLVALCNETALCAENEIILTGGERDIRAPKPYICKKDEAEDGSKK